MHIAWGVVPTATPSLEHCKQKPALSMYMCDQLNPRLDAQLNTKMIKIFITSPSAQFQDGTEYFVASQCNWHAQAQRCIVFLFVRLLHFWEHGLLLMRQVWRCVRWHCLVFELVSWQRSVEMVLWSLLPRSMPWCQERATSGNQRWVLLGHIVCRG